MHTQESQISWRSRYPAIRLKVEKPALRIGKNSSFFFPQPRFGIYIYVMMIFFYLKNIHRVEHRVRLKQHYMTSSLLFCQLWTPFIYQIIHFIYNIPPYISENSKMFHGTHFGKHYTRLNWALESNSQVKILSLQNKTLPYLYLEK